MIKWGQKSKPKKNLGLPTKPEKIPRPKTLTAKKILCRISKPENFPERIT